MIPTMKIMTPMLLMMVKTTVKILMKILITMKVKKRTLKKIPKTEKFWKIMKIVVMKIAVTPNKKFLNGITLTVLKDKVRY